MSTISADKLGQKRSTAQGDCEDGERPISPGNESIANEGRHGPAVSAEVNYETDQRGTYSRFWWRRLSLA